MKGFGISRIGKLGPIPEYHACAMSISYIDQSLRYAFIPTHVLEGGLNRLVLCQGGLEGGSRIRLLVAKRLGASDTRVIASRNVMVKQVYRKNMREREGTLSRPKRARVSRVGDC